MINDNDYEVALMIHNIKDNDDEIEYINARISELEPIIKTLKEHDERIYKVCMLRLYYNDVPESFNDDLKGKFKGLRSTFLQSLPNEEIFIIKENTILSKDLVKKNTNTTELSQSNELFEFDELDIYNIKLIKDKEDDFFRSIEILQSLGIDGDLQYDYKSIIEDVEDKLDFYNTKLNKCERLINSQNKIKDEIIDFENDTTEFNAKQKVVLMIELGIIDFLNANKNFKGNTLNMTRFLEKLTGENHKALQTPINGYLSDTDRNPIKYPTKSDAKVSTWLVNKSYQK